MSIFKFKVEISIFRLNLKTIELKYEFSESKIIIWNCNFKFQIKEFFYFKFKESKLKY
jgi:hypothetical protein